MSSNKRFLPYLLISAATALLVSGCAHTSPFIEEPYLASLGGPGEYVVTMNTQQAAPLLDSLQLGAASPGSEKLLERVSRISFSAVVPELQEDGTYSDIEPSLYGGIEGDLPMGLLNLLLTFFGGWSEGEYDSISYWTAEEGDVAVAVPENGIILFSTADIARPVDQSYRRQKDPIPEDIARKLEAGIIGLYVEKPRNLFHLFEDLIPFSLLQSIERIWLTVDSVGDTYELHGEIDTSMKSATTVISLTLKKKYLERIRKLNEKPEGWMESILVDSETEIIINRIELAPEELKNILNQVTDTMFAE